MTQNELKSIVHYNPETGNFTWIDPSKRHAADGFCGTINKSRAKRYRQMMINYSVLKCHRAAFLYMDGYIPEQVDHINGNGLDNRWSNLRASSAQHNAWNQRRPEHNTSGVMGVYWSKDHNAWRVNPRKDGKRRHVGYFKKFEDAESAVYEFYRIAGFTDEHGDVRPS